MKRNFDEWLSTMKDSIATWTYYVDFQKVYSNVSEIKIELNILNSLIGSKTIKDDFLKILDNYPSTLKVVPILLAKRESEIKVIDTTGELVFDFKKHNYSNEDYADFMLKSGLFDLLQNHVISNLVDYVTGVEVGMDTNGRKNRTGDSMEDLVESYLIKLGLEKNVTYFKEMYKSDVEKTFGINLDNISNNGKTEKRFDFVIYLHNHVYACECNFYGSSGSKLNETARSYKNLALESANISNFTFIWFTDGIGWNTAKHNLEETFDVLDTIYNLKDLEDGILEKLLNVKVTM